MGKWTRRAFIGAGVVAGGALVVGVAIRTGKPDDRIRSIVAGGDGENLINSFVKVDKDNIVTAVVPHAEMGQGVHSTLAQMLADEMDADWEKVRVVEAPAEGHYASKEIGREFMAPDLKVPEILEPTVDGAFLSLIGSMFGTITGGSFSVRGTGQRGMRTAGAAAKEMLVAAAAEKWGVPAGEITAENSMLAHAGSGKSGSFGEFAELATEQDLPVRPKLKKLEDFKLMGKPVPRTDIPGKVDGTAVFGIDAKVPDQTLTYAAVKAPPVVGAKITGMDATAAKAMPGVQQILNMEDFVAVVADGYWQAQQALNTIKIDYSKTESDALDQEGIFKRYAAALDEAGSDGGDEETSAGDVKEGYAGAAKKLTAEYKAPFLAHATMEPQNCTAWVHDGQCDIWQGSQVPTKVRKFAAELLDIPVEKVNFQNTYLGGGFGRRSETDAVEMAVRISKATGNPVKLIWSREEDTQHDWYRPSSTSRFEAGLDENGRLVSWNNVHTHLFDPPEAAQVPYYAIPNHLIRKVDVPMHLRFGPWRSVDHSHNSWFIESFLDEVALEAGKDPLEQRRELLKDQPRFLAVLDKVAEMSNWKGERPEGTGLGIAIAPSFGSIVAQVAEVEIASGTPKVTKVWCCADIGYAMNPDSAAAQMESAIIYGLTAVLYGEISVRNGAVEQSNFHDYQMLRINESPEIEVAFINGDSEGLGGAGEPGLPPLAPAVTNAIFAASGKRVRELPLSKHSFG
ncbi:isoquinoline 1-oxidoreductase, beta subunit [Parasphingorhabdus marina DSM 22363]|uniref:Isoquinoline 1-oxidoreductase, beta subunit n=1 Tax=Parasphingorhabdus marina DSM 22363 TaxID=1123272 RepID=A0A1N6D1P8_9SPHN|nr:molybdopterin cofactor-binding domain-containing protein [Parasphingorhabdus marina]SIN64715.1 isoquinoline 1-oxidoreductase, beta subunit [Parasphingorhabdus marina DSM 22363]